MIVLLLVALVEVSSAQLRLATQAPVSLARTQGDLEFVAQSGGWIRALTLDGNLAFVGEGPLLRILDVSDANVPVALGEVGPLPSLVRGVAVANGYAYVAAEASGLWVFDVSDPTFPVQVSSLPTSGPAIDVAVAGSTVYLVGTEGLAIVDVSDPTSPLELALVATPAPALAVRPAGGHAYVAAERAGLRVFDVSAAAAPREVAVVQTTKAALDVTLAGSYAYVAAGDAGLRVVDVSTPHAPREVGRLESFKSAQAVRFSGKYALVADFWSGLQVVDVSDPANPVLRGGLGTADSALTLAVNGERVFVSTRDQGLRSLRLAKGVPSLRGTYRTAGAVQSVRLQDERAYLASREGLRIADVSDPMTTQPLGSWTAEGSLEAMQIEGGLAFLAERGRGMRILDVSDPTNPVSLSLFPLRSAYGVAVLDGYAYVANGTHGLWILDVSDPAAPAAVGLSPTSDRDVAVRLVGSSAYVAADEGGLRVIDVSDPTAPVQVGSFETLGEVRDLEVKGDRVYLAASGAGVRIVDVSDRSSPVEIGSNDDHFARGLDVAGSHVFVASEQSGLWVLDASDPGRPVTRNVFDTWGSADSVTVNGGKVYVGDRAGGLIILHSSAAFAAWQSEQEKTLATARPAPERRVGWLPPREQPQALGAEAAAFVPPWLDRVAGYAACWLAPMEPDRVGGSILASWQSVLAAACSAATSPAATISSITPQNNNHIMARTVRGAGFSPTAGR